jgi:hypothetical protein
MSSVQQPPDGGDGDGFSRSLITDRLIKGIVAKWDDQKKWHDRDGLSLPSPMFVVGVNTALQRWQNRQAETILDKPLPDPAQLNAAIPQSDWELDLNNKPRPPWELVYAVYMIDLTTGTTYTYLSGTVGARICFEQLQESVCIMRALRGGRILPLVRLEQRPFRTGFGMRSRPHLQIIDWRAPGGDGGGPLLSPRPSNPQLTGPTAASPAPDAAPNPAPSAPPTAVPPTAAEAASTRTATASTPAATATLDATQQVKPVSVAELVSDEIPWK